jgi:quercetin dioxygenase-like cupin family protein
MSLNIRRVVTGHDDQGRAKVMIDETVKNVVSQRPGALYSVIWSSEGFPINNDAELDPSGKKIGTTISDGTVFRIVSFGPGVAPRNHRTDSIDYAVVMSGEIDMDLDGTVVHLRAGDVLVQRGTIHNWINKGSEACVIAFVLISAKSVTAGGKTLPEPRLASLGTMLGLPVQLCVVPENSHFIESDSSRTGEIGFDARTFRDPIP